MVASLMKLLRTLPRGSTLPRGVWEQRHFGILVLLWCHVPALFLFAVASGETVVHSAFEALVVLAFALATTLTRANRSQSTLAASLGLMTCSAILVHLSHGLIEMHFHYFVMVGVITLYQEWRPFLISIAYVVVQHGIAGVLDPESVYNHTSAIEQPWLWAGVHGLFILAMSVTGIASWRLNETLLMAAERRQTSLEEAQRVALLGSWEWDASHSRLEWSDEMYRLLGLSAGDVVPSTELFLSFVHPDDRQRAVEITESMPDDGSERGGDFRVVLADGTVRWLAGRVRPGSDSSDHQPVAAGTLQDVTEERRAENELRDALSLLNATLDSTADGILVVDLNGSIVSFNRRFTEMWRMPPDILEVADDDQALSFVLDQLADPDSFVAKVQELYAQPDADSMDTILFSDGRVFERFSTPQRVDGDVVGRVWSFRDVTEHARLEQELVRQAFHDSLTGLPNQALFRDRLDHALVRSGRNHSGLAVLFVDLDNFKTVNDSLGHTAGDDLLVLVTEQLLGCIRVGDTAARLGGDEFAVLLEDLDGHDVAVGIAERIIAAVNQPLRVGGQDLYASASIGIAFAESGVGVDQLMRNADLAMYTAKRRGKCRHELFATEMHTAAVHRLELEGDLRRALETPHELELHFQPIVSLSGGGTWAVEALVRWRHPTRGLLAPGDFIGVAEETGQVVEVGRIVLMEACHQAQRLRERHGQPDLALTVNLAPRHLLGGGIVGDVTEALATTGLPPSALIVEITEGAMMEDPDLAIETLGQLKAMGVRLAVDDFGTGYSSLSYLQRFPIDIVKVDRSFVEKLIDDGDASLVPAILGLARSLGLTPVAEGVEDSSQAARLSDLGCDLAQGFHLSRPMDAMSLDEHLARTRGVATHPSAPVVRTEG